MRCINDACRTVGQPERAAHGCGGCGVRIVSRAICCIRLAGIDAVEGAAYVRYEVVVDNGDAYGQTVVDYHCIGNYLSSPNYRKLYNGVGVVAGGVVGARVRSCIGGCVRRISYNGGVYLNFAAGNGVVAGSLGAAAAV